MRNKSILRISSVRLTLMLSVILLVVGTGQAATLFVTNTNDSGPGSLRETVANASLTGDLIRFNLSGCPCTITLTSGEIVIDKALFIDGLGIANLTDRITISGNNSSRIFRLPGDWLVTLRDLTLTNGNVPDDGGAIHVSGDGRLILERVYIENSQANGSGGAIYQGPRTTPIPTEPVDLFNSIITNNRANVTGGGIFGSVNLQESTVADNTVTAVTAGSGGGIFSPEGVSTYINRSTIANNTVTGNAAFGGGIYNDGGTVAIVNSTISRNTADGVAGSRGGGIDSDGTLYLTYCTITANSATNSTTGSINAGGGGVAFTGGTAANVINTIIAGNTASPDGRDIWVTAGLTFNSQGYNLIGVESGNQGFNQPTDQKGTTFSPLNPMLVPDSGSPTAVYHLLPGSPAIDKGAATLTPPPSIPIPSDQIGVARPFDYPNIPNAPGGNGSDIGAIERNFISGDTTPPVITPSVFGVLGSNSWFVSDVRVSWSVVDNESPVTNQTGCAQQDVNQDTGGITFTCTATSAGGTSSQSVTISRDSTSPTLAPVVSPNPVAQNAAATASPNASDGVSGIASQSCAPVNTSTLGNFSVSCTATDNAGNTATASANYQVVQTPPTDTTPPVITPNVVGTAGINGWYRSNVQVTWTVVDNESPISSQNGCDRQDVTQDTSGITLTCTATSAGGTNSRSVTIRRDSIAPNITFNNRTAPNANGWNNTNVTVTWDCSDLLSGPVSPIIVQTLNGEGANQSATGTCFDQAGHSVSNTVGGINIDKTPPTLAPVVTPNPVAQNGSATALPNAADALSGIASQSCAPVNTSVIGNFTVNCTAADRAGNTAAANASYQVISTSTNNLIVFSSFDLGNFRIFKMNSDGTGITRLTSGNLPDFEPVLSPDKTKIAFARGIAFSDIYVMNVDGSGLRRLTNDFRFNGSPSWSPDGTKIAFNTYRFSGLFAGNIEIAVMNADGTNVRRLTISSSQNRDPVWSPDGTKIAFVSNRFGGNWEILVLNVLNPDAPLTRITNHTASDITPTWSPDGTRIAFASSRFGNLEILTVNADGSGPVTRLTNNSAIDTEPAWGADGRILFTSTRTIGNRYPHIMNPDGSGVFVVTTSRSGSNPHW